MDIRKNMRSLLYRTNIISGVARVSVQKFRPTFAGLLTLAAFTSPVARGTEFAYTFSHLAGSGGGPGSVDGSVETARFWGPTSVILDGGNNLYIADTSNNTIRKITPTGVVSTLAGAAGQKGSTDGVGSNARFWVPEGLSADAAGNIYVADEGNNTIRKITANGTVSTLAGITGLPGSQDGRGSSALFRNPTATAVDAAGNIYVTDSGNYTIRKISADGLVTTLAGTTGRSGSLDGTGSAAQFGELMGITVDSDGVLYAADATNNTVRRITPAGVVTTLAGAAGQSGGTDGVGSAARFFYPWGISADKTGNLYIGDKDNHTIRQITPTGIVTTVAGRARDFDFSDGPGATARFLGPTGLAIDSSNNIYVADAGNHSIRRITAERLVSTLAGQPPQTGTTDGTGATARFWSPVGVAVDQTGNAYVADQYYKDGRIRKVSPDGVVTTIGQASAPDAIAVDSAGTVYVVDRNVIYKLSPFGAMTPLAGNQAQYGSADGTGAAAQFFGPSGIAVDSKGNVFVADTGNQTIRKVTPEGVVTTMAGAVGVAGYADGPSSLARFNSPSGIAIAKTGEIYVSEGGNHVIRRIAPDTGMVATLAGSASPYGASTVVDGNGADARFISLLGIAVDLSGNVFVSDYQVIRKVSPAGEVTTLGGLAGVAGSQDGVGPEARFFQPQGLAVDRPGNLYVADAGNEAIRKGVPFASTTHLSNIATRALSSTDNKVTIGGFVVSGSANKRILIRAVGPSLTAQGIGASEVLLDPTIEVHDAIHGNSIVATNDNLSDNPNAAEIAATASAIGASALLGTDTKSSALLLTLAPGVYSFVVNGKAGNSGVVLLEVYDADPTPTGSTFTNIATRAYATIGNGVTIGGFVLSGNAPKHVLLRAIGPTLTKQGLGVSEILTDPTIELHDAINGNVIIATNDNWTEHADAVRTTGARIGASPIDASDTTSSAIVTTLSPGVYSFVVNGNSSTTGIVLVEIYDAD